MLCWGGQGITNVIQTSGSDREHPMGARPPKRPQNTNRRSRLRPNSKLPARTRSGSSALRLAKRPQPSPPTRPSHEGTARTVVGKERHLERHENRTLRRLQQLVRGLRVLGPTVLRRQERRFDERWKEEVE